MPMRGRPAVLLASLSLLGFGAGGCGGNQPSAGPSSRTSSSPSSGPAGSYHAGEPCAGRSEPLYAAAGLNCVTGRLQPALTAHYHAGQFCSGRTAASYAASGLSCVQGRLEAK